MLEKTEGLMNNGQSRPTGHIRKSTQYNRKIAKKKKSKKNKNKNKKTKREKEREKKQNTNIEKQNNKQHGY